MLPARYSPSQKEIDAFRQTLIDGHDPKPIGKAFGMTDRTIRKYQHEILKTNYGRIVVSHRGGRRNVRINEVVEDWMIKFVESHSDSTLEEIRDNAFQHFRFPYLQNISLETIFNHLDGKLISYKHQRYISPDANSPENLNKRVEYLHQLTHLDVNLHQIYIDETNFTIMTRRNHGRSKIGERATKVTVINGCKKVNMIAAVSPSLGWVFHENTQDNVNSEKFESFINNLINFLNTNHPGEKFAFILDNAPIHRKNVLATLCINAGVVLIFLPPYSPFLNPIERCFSKIKSQVKKWLRENNDRMLATTSMEFGQKGAARSKLLDEAISFGISKISINNVRKYLEYSRKFYPNIFQKEPIVLE